MKKKVCIILTLIAVICSQIPVYAKDENLWEMQLYGWYVKMDDVYDLNELYQENPHMTRKEAAQFLIERAGNYRSDIYKQSEMLILGICGYVIDEEGYGDFQLYSFLPNASYAGPDVPYTLASVSSTKYYPLNESEDELKKFIKESQEISKRDREINAFVRKNLSDSDYMGVNVNNQGEVYVLLCNEDKAEILEAEGIKWELSHKSREERYEDIQKLWKQKDELNILELDEETDGGIAVLGLDSEEKFYENITEKEPGYYRYSCDKDFWRDERLSNVSQVSDLDDIKLFLLMKKEDGRYGNWSDDYFEKLEQFITNVHKNYPEYSYENLFGLGYLCNDESYYNRNDELDNFLKTCLYIENKKNPFDESNFGDAQHLAIKIALQKYKELHPKESYEGLYEKYLKDINENENLSQKQKRGRYCWKIFKAEEELKNKEETGGTGSLPIAIAGISVLVIGAVAVKVWMRKEEKK